MSVPRRSEKVKRALQELREGTAYSVAEVASRHGLNASYLRQLARSEGITTPGSKHANTPGDDRSEQERELAQRLLAAKTRASSAQTEVRVQADRVKELEGSLVHLEAEIDLVRESAALDTPTWLKKPKRDKGTHRGTLVACFSDYHIGEVVDPAEMAGYNAYNSAIAEQRVRRFFERTILVARQYLAGVKYDGIVVPNLGDTISGDIHDEFRETNELSNYKAAPLAANWISAGLQMLHEEFGKVHVPCVPGNHPRDSRKPRYKKRTEHNADTMISQLCERDFRDNDDVTFDIPAGISADFSIYDTKFRIEHGDEARGGSGIQGAMLPIALRTHRVRKQAEAEGRPFDVLLLGHWHQLMFMVGKGFIVNGTGKGYDEFARGKGFEPEPPQQALFVVTPEHGISAQLPLFVCKRDDEGW